GYDDSDFVSTRVLQKVAIGIGVDGVPPRLFWPRWSPSLRCLPLRRQQLVGAAGEWHPFSIACGNRAGYPVFTLPILRRGGHIGFRHGDGARWVGARGGGRRAVGTAINRCRKAIRRGSRLSRPGAVCLLYRGRRKRDLLTGRGRRGFGRDDRIVALAS